MWRSGTWPSSGRDVALRPFGHDLPRVWAALLCTAAVSAPLSAQSLQPLRVSPLDLLPPPYTDPERSLRLLYELLALDADRLDPALLGQPAHRPGARAGRDPRRGLVGERRTPPPPGCHARSRAARVPRRAGEAARPARTRGRGADPPRGRRGPHAPARPRRALRRGSARAARRAHGPCRRIRCSRNQWSDSGTPVSTSDRT